MTHGAPVTYRIHTVSGDKETLSEVQWLGFDHSLTTALIPGTAPKTLLWNGGVYIDFNHAWTLVNSFDWRAARDAAAEGRARQAAAVLDAECGSAVVDGVTYYTIAGHATAIPPQDGIVAYSLRLDPATGLTLHLSTDYDEAGKHVTVTRDVTPAPGLTLPVPDP